MLDGSQSLALQFPQLLALLMQAGWRLMSVSGCWCTLQWRRVLMASTTPRTLPQGLQPSARWVLLCAVLLSRLRLSRVQSWLSTQSAADLRHCAGTAICSSICGVVCDCLDGSGVLGCCVHRQSGPKTVSRRQALHLAILHAQLTARQHHKAHEHAQAAIAPSMSEPQALRVQSGTVMLMQGFRHARWRWTRRSTARSRSTSRSWRPSTTCLHWATAARAWTSPTQRWPRWDLFNVSGLHLDATFECRQDCT